MSWQTAAVRYVSIGERSARFRDLVLPFTLENEPVESVIWMPNGGGKSSLMSLKSAVILPAARDFTGAGRETGEKRPRRLDDYVASGDTSHTVIEWTADDTTTLLGQRHRLLTGAVYEWPERRRPGSEHDARLNKLWWSAVPSPGILDVTTLPVRADRLLTLSQFRDGLRQLNSEHPELQIRIAPTQNAWEDQLGELGIDTALYRYQARMNTSEGGIAKVFKFNTVRDFVDLIVDVIAHPDQAGDCGRVVGQHAKNLFRRPALETEREFLTEARAILDDLAAAHATVDAAVAERDTARSHAGTLRASLAMGAALSASRAEQRTREAQTASERASEARRERGRLEGVRAELLLRAARERQARAEQAVSAAEKAERFARAELAAWAAAGPLAQAAGHDAAAERLREALRPERAQRVDLATRHDVAATAVRCLLEQAAQRLDAEARQARDKAHAATERGAAVAEQLRIARTEMSAAERASAGAQALLDDHERALSAARRAGILGADESPAVARAGHESRAADADAAVARHAAERDRQREQASQAAAEATTHAVDATRLAAESEQASEHEGRLRDAHDALAGHSRLVALAEAERVIDVWGDAARVRSALTDAARSFEAQALAEAVEAADDERLIAGVDRTGLLPGQVATTAAAQALTHSGVTAETAWDVLARDYAAEARATAAETRPDVVSGVVVQDEPACERAVALLASSPTLTHIPVVTAADLARAAHGALGNAALPAVPLHPGLHAPAQAQSAAETMRADAADRDRRRADLTDRARADQDLLRRLSAFLAEHPHSDSLTRATAATAAARHGAQSAAAERSGAEARAAEHTMLAEHAQQLQQEAERERGNATRAADACRNLEAAAARVNSHHEALELARAAEQDARRRIETLEDTGQALTVEAADAAAERREKNTQAGQTRAQAGAIALVGGNTDRVDDVAVAALAARGLSDTLAGYEALHQQWQTASSSSVLEANLAAAERSAADARTRARQALSGYDGDPDAVLTQAEEYAREHTAESCHIRQRDFASAVEGALVATTRARGSLEAANAVLSNCEAVHARAQRVSGTIAFTSPEEAEGRAEVLAAEIGALSSRETALGNERAELEARAREDSTHADSLRDLAERLPAAVDSQGKTPLEVDLPEARGRVSAALGALAAAAEAMTRAQERRADVARLGLQLAGRHRYQELPLAVRDRLADTDVAGLSTRADQYSREVQVRLAQVDELLVQIGQDETRVSQLVAMHVRQILTGLAGAARASVLPPGLGELSGKQFMNLRFANPSEDELSSRVGQEILALLDAARGDAKSLPSGETVLRRCVHAAVGSRGFRAEVLKPNEHMLEQRVNVTDVGRFSDGEKLTTCVLLFCAFARMREHGRAVAGTGATGTLMLDNPFGQASTAQLVALQLAVARAQRVHLVYATGLEDMGALLQFRRLIRLRNRKPVGGTDGHVQLEDGGARRGEVTAVTVVRPDGPVPAELSTSSGNGRRETS